MGITLLQRLPQDLTNEAAWLEFVDHYSGKTNISGKWKGPTTFSGPQEGKGQAVTSWIFLKRTHAKT
jgi:hypothetical protein